MSPASATQPVIAAAIEVEQPVADVDAEAAVEVAEAVDVDQQHVQRTRVALRAANLGAKRAQEVGARVQPGGLVEHGERLPAGGLGALLADELGRDGGGAREHGHLPEVADRRRRPGRDTARPTAKGMVTCGMIPRSSSSSIAPEKQHAQHGQSPTCHGAWAG